MCMGSDPKSETDYRAEEDHRTLSRAAEIRQDPSRMSAVASHHKKVRRQLASVGRSLRKGRSR